MRGPWLDLKSQLTEPLLTKVNKPEELIATLASKGMGNLKAVRSLGVVMKLLSKVEETVCFIYGRGFAFVKVWAR